MLQKINWWVVGGLTEIICGIGMLVTLGFVRNSYRNPAPGEIGYTFHDLVTVGFLGIAIGVLILLMGAVASTQDRHR